MGVSEILFDERVSAAMARLERGPANIDELAAEAGIDSAAMAEKLGPLLEENILVEKDGAISVDAEKLDEALEADQSRFDGVVDGLTKMDGYLN